ncbi:unnamed protein product [Tuber melanosporum]|uniref:(Perigord truffle) hypothetical protein n=1 Tax=Tuber melanosporum (strain Mel28) TaxID=656061 RepID=D5GAW1_TUBMM|nr:uncharacterized protein GSTUM_00005332001 [Tuber melanosporum]CAZ81654.1 unnamed protein product [Tuber melanosporum]
MRIMENLLIYANGRMRTCRQTSYNNTTISE